MDDVRSRLPYLSFETTRHGRKVWYFRREHGPRIRIRGAYGGPEFQAEYHAAISGQPLSTGRPRPSAHTLEWALDRYRASSAWAALSPATRKQRENIYRAVIAASGGEPLSAINAESILAGRERRAAVPHSANNFLKAMRGFFGWATAKDGGDLIGVDPTKGIRLLTGANDRLGFHTWTEEEVEQFEARWPIGTKQRLALDLLLYTGLRRGDVVRVGQPNVHGGAITIRPEKSRGETVVTIPVLPALAASIKATPTGIKTFLVTSHGKPFVKEGFGNWFREAAKEAKVPGSAHGLRKAGATRAAENGASERQLMAIFGWETPKMAAHYTKAADRKRLAMSANELLLPVRAASKITVINQ